MIKRRAFITLLGSAAAAWPFAARAQQAHPARHIGVFLGLAASADDPGAGEIVRPFKAAMQEAGWIDGKNIRLDYRFGGGDITRINAAAAELVALAPELIYATGLPPVQALRQKTRAIPIVFSLAQIMHDGEELRDGCGEKRAIHVANRCPSKLPRVSALRHSRHDRRYAASLRSSICPAQEAHS